MAKICDEDLVASALLSEKIYFGLGAQEQSGPGWTFTNMPGLETLPAANVCILESEVFARTGLAAVIEDIEGKFVAAGACRARFYAGETASDFQSLMTEKGYSRRTEIIHAHAPPPDAGGESPDPAWKPVRSERDWSEKGTIHAQPSFASDGYDAAPEIWMELERRKAATGGIEFLLFMLGGVAVATTGLMRLPSGIIRIKNYYVRPDRRGQGVGKMALRKLLQDELVSPGQMSVVLSVEGSVGQKLYNSVGSREIGRIYEWARPLQPGSGS